MTTCRPYIITGMSPRNDPEEMKEEGIRPGEPIASPLPLPVRRERAREEFPHEGHPEDEFDIEISDEDISMFENDNARSLNGNSAP